MISSSLSSSSVPDEEQQGGDPRSLGQEPIGQEPIGQEPTLPPGQDVAVYVADMTSEMAAMARTAGYDLLAYFLDMARIEAKIQAEKHK